VGEKENLNQENGRGKRRVREMENFKKRKWVREKKSGREGKEE
jgi:hypothetical protein